MIEQVNNIFRPLYFRSNRFRKAKIHLLAWAIFIVYEVWIVASATNMFGAFWFYVVHYAINILLFYVHAYGVMPLLKLKSSKRIIFLICCVVLEISLFIIIKNVIDDVLLGVFDWRQINLSYDHGYVSIWRAFTFLNFATVNYFFEHYIKVQQLNKASLKERHAAEIQTIETREQLKVVQNAYLKAQINPHFFFNTLTFLHALTLNKAPVAAKGIITLSKIMRYAINTDQQAPFVVLSEEIEQVQNLINLQKLRKKNQFNIQFIYEDNILSLPFIPLIILTLVENMYKHGDLSNPGRPGYIEIYLDRQNLYIKTHNPIKTGLHSSGKQIGMSNISNRLDNTYGNKATFNYGTKDNCFETIITVTMD